MRKQARQIVYVPAPEIVDREAAKAQAKADLQAKRQARAEEALARWQRRLKVAQNKVRKLTRTLTYYAKKGVTP